MSERLTHEELRDEWLCETDHGTMECLCLQDWPAHRPEHHRPGCPCDKGNVVVGREVLRKALDLVESFTDNYRVKNALRAALGEEPAP